MKSVMIATVAGLAVSSAFASPLLPGGSVSPIPVYTNSLLTATLVAPYLQMPFSSGGLFAGTLNMAVFTNMPDNPYGSTFLSFAYQLSNDASSSNSLGRFTVNGYSGFLTDVGTDGDAVYNTPAYLAGFEATRQSDGSSIGFSFLNGGGFSQIGPGGFSRVFIVHTNATAWTMSPASVIDGDIATTEAYSPVPTPGAGALLGMGLIAAGRRRR